MTRAAGSSAPRRCRRIVLLLACVAVLLPALPAAAHPLAHPTLPRVTNVRPAAGAVLPAGQPVVVGALLASDQVSSATVSVDGQPLDSEMDASSHPTVVARLDDATPGEHIATVRVTDGQGRSAERSWRFTISGLRFERLAGTGRVETAVAVSRDLYPLPLDAAAAVLARADDYPDALAGVPAAHAADAPLLLTDSAALSAATAEELRRALPPLSTVYLLGGTAALSRQVEADVRALGLLPERVEGGSRYATAAALAAFQDAPTAAFVVSGASFADALSASAPAAVNRWPVLLTLPDAVPSETRAVLAEGDFQQVFVVGGAAAVSDGVLAELRRIVPTVTRLAGPGRYDTADAVARTFFAQADVVAVANGERFPDALSGGRHASALGAPLLLSPADAVLAPQLDALGRYQPTAAVLYGGRDALGADVEGGLLRGVVDAGGPQVVTVTPAPGTELHTFDELVIQFDRELAVQHSVVYVTVGDNEVAGTVRAGDFPTTLVFNAAELPSGLQAGVVHEVRVVAAAFDGTSWRHLDERYTYRKLDLSRGDSGPAVAELQGRLVAAGYWLGTVDGAYGTLTHQAVLAFQKVHGLPRDGVYNRTTRSLLESSPSRPAARSTRGLVIEVDKARQVLLMVRDGQVEWIFNTSTGTEQPYTYEGRRYLADTPPGRWTITRQIDGVREGNLGRLYRPKYFHPDGIAVHGSSSVPAYPASHGCVRVTNAAIDWMWADDRVPLGTAVWVY